MKFVWVTDVPTPYRNHSFERMAAIFPELGIDFSVAFMAGRSKLRPWSFRKGQLRFPHRVYSGVHPVLWGTEQHVNPRLLFDLRRHAADVVMVGGWASPSHLWAPWAIPDGVVRVLGCESHLDSTAQQSKVLRWIKRKTIERYDAFLVPQRRSLELLMALDTTARDKPYLIFPNTVDGRVFRDGVAAARTSRDAIRREIGVRDAEQMWLCCARLAPEKGLGEFIPTFANIPGVKLWVAGDGPLRTRLAEMAHERGAPVGFLGHKSEAELVRLYAAADLFVLPSLRDPSPLSVIEACAAGLPIYVSDRVGNVDDVLIGGENGFAYKPGDDVHNTRTARTIAKMQLADLAKMGERSLHVYAERFDTDSRIRQLGTNLRNLHAARPRHATVIVE